MGIRKEGTKVAFLYRLGVTSRRAIQELKKIKGEVGKMLKIVDNNNYRRRKK